MDSGYHEQKLSLVLKNVSCVEQQQLEADSKSMWNNLGFRILKIYPWFDQFICLFVCIVSYEKAD